MTMTSGKQGLSVGNELSDPDGYSLGDKITFIGFHEPNGTNLLLLQSGDYLLLQNGGKIILEAA